MKLTEEEARTKWCPYIRIHEQPPLGIGGPNMYAYNRPHNMSSMTCIASECMAWRFSGFLEKGEECPVSGITVQEHTPTGYCGLAGKPS